MAEKIFDKGYFRESTPGELYRQIEVSREDFGGGEKKLSKKTVHPFVSLCRKINSMFPSLGKNSTKFEPKYKDAVDFLDWDLTPSEFNGSVIFVFSAWLLPD